MVLHMYNKLSEIHCTSADELNRFNESIREKKCHIWALIYRYPIHCVIHCENNSIPAPLQSLFLLSSSGEHPLSWYQPSFVTFSSFSNFSRSLSKCAFTSGSRLPLSLSSSLTALLVAPRWSQSFLSSCVGERKKEWEKKDICTMSLTLKLLSRAQERSSLLTLLTWSSW